MVCVTFLPETTRDSTRECQLLRACPQGEHSTHTRVCSPLRVTTSGFGDSRFPSPPCLNNGM